MEIEKNGQLLTVNQLSDGEKCLIAMVSDLARRMAIANPTAEEPTRRRRHRPDRRNRPASAPKVAAHHRSQAAKSLSQLPVPHLYSLTSRPYPRKTRQYLSIALGRWKHHRTKTCSILRSNCRTHSRRFDGSRDNQANKRQRRNPQYL